MAERSRQRSLFDPDPEADAPSVSADEVLAAVESCGFAADEPPPETLAGKKVYVVDSHSLIHQVFHALPEMTSPAGEPVGAVFGFARDVFYLLESKRPDYLFCAFDLPGKTFRHQIFEDYKKNRAEMPVDLAPQFALIRKVMSAMGVPCVGCESYEADDLLATIARRTEQLGGECYLVTGDKDCRQLITDRVKVYNIRKDQVLDRDALKADWGIAPEQVVDFQALVGDPTDNVPGVPLIGPKLAQQLLEKYVTLEGIFEHLDEISGAKRKQNLAAGREQAEASRKLVRLDANAPCAIPWSSAQLRGYDRGKLRELFRSFGFRSLVDKADQMAEQLAVSRSEPRVIERKPEVPCERRIVDTPEALAELARQMAAQSRVSLDLETTHVQPRWAEVVGLSFAWREEEAFYVPVCGPPGEQCLDRRHVLETLRPVLENADIEKVGQNLKYDMIVLRGAGIDLAGVRFDTMVASYLLEAGQRNHNLNDLAKRYLDRGKTDIRELIGSGKNQRRMDEVPIRQVADYACDDALLPLRLQPILAARLEEQRLQSLFADLEMPLVGVLADLEFNGIRVDCQRLSELSSRFGERIASLEQEIYELAGRRFNIASPKQLQEILFVELKLPAQGKTKTGLSTDADVLEELARVHPLPAKILEYRQYAKLKGTYVDALPELVHPQTKRVHASFHQAVAATGRLSSSDPNLQNIPIRTEAGREIRSAFVPGEEGWLLLAADYSQIELRVLAHFCGDERLREAFAQDQDIHAEVASRIYGVPLGEVTSEMRRQAKAVNFGVIYGQSPFGLARELGISKDEAAAFIDAYFQGYPGIGKFLDQILADCYESGYVSTILGRQREIRGVRPNAGRQRNLSERTAINTVIQGSAADLIKLAMLAIHRRLRQEGFAARMLLQIHDELVFEFPQEERSRLAQLVAEEMINAQCLEVPLKVDLKVGPNWADAKRIESPQTKPR